MIDLSWLISYHVTRCRYCRRLVTTVRRRSLVQSARNFYRATTTWRSTSAHTTSWRWRPRPTRALSAAKCWALRARSTDTCSSTPVRHPPSTELVASHLHKLQSWRGPQPSGVGCRLSSIHPPSLLHLLLLFAYCCYTHSLSAFIPLPL